MGEEETNHTQTGLVIFLVAMTKYPMEVTSGRKNSLWLLVSEGCSQLSGGRYCGSGSTVAGEHG